MKKQRINKVGKWTASLSFLIGTLFLMTFYFSSYTGVAISAYAYIITAGIFNIVIILVLAFKATTDKENRKGYLKTFGIMLINIPVVVLYFYFVLVLINTMRVEIINETSRPITQIKLLGCEQKTIENLEINESVTSWVAINRDCSIQIEYNIDGKMETRSVYGYVTTSMGQKIRYRIGSQNTAIDESF